MLQSIKKLNSAATEIEPKLKAVQVSNNKTELNTQQNIYNHSIKYAKIGWAVFPVHSIIDGHCTCGNHDCKSPGKHPRTKNGHNDASTDKDLIAEWFLSGSLSNIGIATGKISGIAVLDVDQPNGFESFQLLEKEVGTLPHTSSVSTGGEGAHLYFGYPADGINSKNSILTGLDLKADGGYIIAPPSVHVTGNTYKWDNGYSNLHDFPDELLTYLKIAKYPSNINITPGNTVNGMEPIFSGQRNSTLMSIAGTLRYFGMVENEISKILHQINANRCKPPLDLMEVEQIVSSISKYPSGTDTIKYFFYKNEVGDALLFVKQYFGKLVYSHQEKKWFRFNGQHWEPDKLGKVISDVGTVVEAYSEEKKHNEENKDYVKALRKRIHSLNTRHRRNNILPLAATHGLGISADGWDNFKMKLPCENGVIDLNSGKLNPGKPSDYIRTVIPVEYEGLDATAPQWENFISQIFDKNIELIEYVQKAFGYAITGAADENVLFFLYGPNGQNGKTTLLELINAVLGDLSHTTDPDLLLSHNHKNSGSGPKPEVLALKGKRIIFSSECESGRKLDHPSIKRLTGGDTLSARALYSNDIINFQPSHTIFFLINHLPKASVDDPALWLRLRVIPFNLSFVEKPDPKIPYQRKRDISLPRKLRQELPGILSWLVKGCIMYNKEGLEPPALIKGATEEYHFQEDDFSNFIDDHCELSPELKCQSSTIYECYKNWCSAHEKEVMSFKAFGIKMGQKFQKVKTKGFIHYHGVAPANYAYLT